MVTNKELLAELMKIIKKKDEQIEKLSKLVDELKNREEQVGVPTSRLAQDVKSQALSTPLMQAAVEKILEDWRKVKTRD